MSIEDTERVAGQIMAIDMTEVARLNTELARLTEAERCTFNDLGTARQDILHLKAEIARLNDQLRVAWHRGDQLNELLGKAEREVARLRSGLEFLGCDSNWISRVFCDGDREQVWDDPFWPKYGVEGNEQIKDPAAFARQILEGGK